MATKKQEPTGEKRQYYFMICGELVFSVNNDEGVAEGPMTVRQNCVVMAEKPNQFAVEQLAKSQQTLQMQLFNKMGAEATNRIKMIDVVIMNIMPLGHFTPSEFNKLPQGMKVQEKAPEPLSNVPLSENTKTEIESVLN